MSERIFADISEGKIFIHFCEPNDMNTLAVRFPLWWRDIAVVKLDGSSLRSTQQLFVAVAEAFKMPKGFYGAEEYAPNADAFLEYLDDVHEWIPAKGHVVLVENAQQMWRDAPKLAGLLVELWQFATGRRQSDIHLVFVWWMFQRNAYAGRRLPWSHSLHRDRYCQTPCRHNWIRD